MEATSASWGGGAFREEKTTEAGEFVAEWHLLDHAAVRAEKGGGRLSVPCLGMTDVADWKDCDGLACVDVDTSHCRFDETPVYVATLLGNGDVSRRPAPTAIYSAKPDSFRVYPGTDVEEAQELDYRLSYQAVLPGVGMAPCLDSAGTCDRTVPDFGFCAGRTIPGVTKWQQEDDVVVYVDVEMSCPAVRASQKTPVIISSLGGGSSYNTTGGTSIFNPSTNGFRRYVRKYREGYELEADKVSHGKQWYINWMAIVPGLAEAWGWHLNVEALGACADDPLPDDIDWTSDYCDPFQGKVIHEPLPKGQPFDDGDPCTADDAMTPDGRCVGDRDTSSGDCLE